MAKTGEDWDGLRNDQANIFKLFFRCKNLRSNKKESQTNTLPRKENVIKAVTNQKETRMAKIEKDLDGLSDEA